MSEDEYTPLIDRQREPESRVNEELTRTARERLATTLLNLGSTKRDQQRYIRDALYSTMELVGTTPVLDSIPSFSGEDISNEDSVSLNNAHRSFIYNGNTVLILTYTEQMISRYRPDWENEASENELQEKWGDVSEKDSAIGKIRKMLITEGMLWEIEWAGEGGVIKFVPLESEAMEEMDEKVQALAEEEPWEDALQGYNDAFERYLNGDFDETLVTKLYNSIEEVLQTICVDLEGWTDDRDRSHGDYLDMLDENGVYNANGITAPELNQLLDALEKMVSKAGNDRKQRHAYHDRVYCTLLIHQVGAYLYFLISRYEDYKN